jgi:hypothetical protein
MVVYVPDHVIQEDMGLIDDAATKGEDVLEHRPQVLTAEDIRRVSMEGLTGGEPGALLLGYYCCCGCRSQLLFAPTPEASCFAPEGWERGPCSLVGS